MTWNLGGNTGEYFTRHRDAWSYLLDSLLPDVALLQEAIPQPGLERSMVFVQPWASRAWGSAVLAPAGTISKGFANTSRGPVVIAELTKPELVVASIHARIIGGRTIPSLQKTMRYLVPHLSGRRVAVGGDLNTARAAEEIWPGHGHRGFFESLSALDLHDCHWEMHRAEKPSFWGRVSPHDLQLDHLFVDSRTAAENRVLSCEIHDTAEVRALSDHAPMVAEIDL